MKIKSDNNKNFQTYIVENIFQKIKYEYLVERDIKYGNFSSMVDYVIELDNHCICIQIKNENHCLSKIKKFIESVNTISKNTSKKCIGIYLILNKLCNDKIEIFDKYNENEDINNKFISIYSENKEDTLKNLINILYQYNIFMYDYDDSCIMQV